MRKVVAGVRRVLAKATLDVEAHRAYYYRVATVVGALLVAGGIATNGQLEQVLTLVGTILGVGSGGLAAVNTSAKPKG